MPKIPTYDGLQVSQQISSQPLVNPDTSGSQGLSNLAKAAQGMHERISQTSAEEAVTAFEREKNAMFFDPEKGYFNSQGRDAYDRAPMIGKDLEKLKRTYSEGLTSDLARQSFDRVATQHITRANNDIMRHASKNLQAWEASTINAQVENTIENATLYWNDSERLGVQRELGRQSVMDSSRIEGLSPEATNERLQTFESSFATGAVQAAIAHGSEQGQEVFDKYKDRLEGPMQLKMQGAIAKRQQVEKTKRDSDQAVLMAGNLVDQYGENPDARASIIEELNSIEDPELRKKATKESMYQLDSKLKADAEDRAGTFEAAENFMIEGGSVEQFIRSNPESWEKLNAKQKRALESGAVITTDHVLLNDLMLLPPSQLAKVNPNDYMSEISIQDRSRLRNEVEAARKSEASPVGRTRAAQTSSSIEQLFGVKKTWNKKEKEKVNQFYAILNDEVQLREQQKGSVLNAQEYGDVLDSMTRKVVKERRYLWDTEQDLTDIPAQDLRSISDYLHQNDIPATAENIFKAYEQANK